MGATTLFLIQQARYLSKDSGNTEYIRGQAELIAQTIDCDGDVGVYEEAIEIIIEMISE